MNYDIKFLKSKFFGQNVFMTKQIWHNAVFNVSIHSIIYTVLNGFLLAVTFIENISPRFLKT